MKTNRAAGLFLLRGVLGIIFMMQGFGKIFKWGISNVYMNFFASFEETLPKPILWCTVYYTSFVEFIAGALLLLGLMRYWAAFALGSVLLIVSFGHGLAQPIWDLQHVFPRTVLLVVFLLLPKDWDRWHLDGIFLKRL